MFLPESNWTLPNSFPNLLDEKLLFIDTETRDPNLTDMGPGFLRNDASLAGFSVATQRGDSWYYPIAHAQGQNFHDPRAALAWFKDLMATKIPKVGHNILYDAEALHSEGIELKGKWHDTMIYDALIDETHNRYNLDSVAERRCGTQKDETLLNEAATALGFGHDVKGNLWQIPPKYVGPYGEKDALILVNIFREQVKDLENNRLWRVAKLESNLLKVLFEMRKQGVLIDKAQAKIYRNELQAELKNLVDQLNGLDIWSPDALADWCKVNNYEFLKTDKGNPSFESTWLSSHADPTLRICARARKVEKVLRDFVDGSLLLYEYGSRIRAQFHTTRRDDYGTRSGRFSSSNPNLQQIPARDDEFGPRLRSLFIPDNGFRWGKFDYSSQEPRITLHFASIHGCKDSASWVARYKRDKAFDIHNLAAAVVSANRFTAKTTGLGITYGMGAPKLSRELDVTVEHAFDLLKTYKKEIPWIPEVFDIFKNQAKRDGYVETFLGRRCHLDEEEEYKALNRAVQGTGADMMKQAIVDVYEQMELAPLLTVHDESNYNILDEEVAWEVVDIMENALDLQVPALVEPELKSNWSH